MGSPQYSGDQPFHGGVRKGSFRGLEPWLGRSLGVPSTPSPRIPALPQTYPHGPLPKQIFKPPLVEKGRHQNLC